MHKIFVTESRPFACCLTYFSQAYEGKQKRRENELQLLLYVKPCSFAAANKQEAKKKESCKHSSKVKSRRRQNLSQFSSGGCGKGSVVWHYFRENKNITKAVMVILHICSNLETQRANEKKQKDKRMHRRKEAN